MESLHRDTQSDQASSQSLPSKSRVSPPLRIFCTPHHMVWLRGRSPPALGTRRGMVELGWALWVSLVTDGPFPSCQGRFTIAAKHHISIAEIYETELVDIEKVSGSRGPSLAHRWGWLQRQVFGPRAPLSVLSTWGVLWCLNLTRRTLAELKGPADDKGCPGAHPTCPCLPRPLPTMSSQRITTKERSPTGTWVPGSPPPAHSRPLSLPDWPPPTFLLSPCLPAQPTSVC